MANSRSRRRLGSHRRAGCPVRPSSCIQAVTSSANATIATQIRLCAKPCSGRFDSPVALATRMRSSARARRHLEDVVSGDPELNRLLEAVQDRKLDPFTAVNEILEKVFKLDDEDGSDPR